MSYQPNFFESVTSGGGALGGIEGFRVDRADGRNQRTVRSLPGQIMTHSHFCPRCRYPKTCDARDCIRENEFECLDCCVRELKSRRPEAFTERVMEVLTNEHTKPLKKTRKVLRKENLFKELGGKL